LLDRFRTPGREKKKKKKKEKKPEGKRKDRKGSWRTFFNCLFTCDRGGGKKRTLWGAIRLSYLAQDQREREKEGTIRMKRREKDQECD